MHFALVARMLQLGTDKCIVQTLVVALAILLNPKMFAVCDDFFRVSMVRRRRA